MSDEMLVNLTIAGLCIFVVVALVGGAIFLERARKRRKEAGPPTVGLGRDLLTTITPREAVTKMNQTLLYLGIVLILLGGLRLAFSNFRDVLALALIAIGLMSFVFKDPAMFAVCGVVVAWGAVPSLEKWYYGISTIGAVAQLVLIGWILRDSVNHGFRIIQAVHTPTVSFFVPDSHSVAA